MVILRSILLGVLIAVARTQTTFESHQVWKVWAFTRDHADILHDLEDNNLIDLWSHVTTSKDIPVLMSLDSKDAQTVADILEASGIRHVLHNDNLQRMIDSSYTRRPHSKRIQAKDFDYFVYHPLSEIEEYLNSVQSEYSTFTNQSVIGRGAADGEKMTVLEIDEKRQETRPNIFIDCGIHAREWVSVALCLYVIGQLTEKRNEPASRKILDKYRVHILPVFNPDGYVFSWDQNRKWRKNRHKVQDNFPCVGVDLNRNFDIHFGELGSSHSPCSLTYVGPGPNSEPETKYFLKYLNSIGKIKGYFNMHAFSQLWMYPYGYTDKPAQNADDLSRVAEAGTDAIEATHGEIYQYGYIYEVIYPASGSITDYIYDKIGAEYSYALELRDEGQHGFVLPEYLIQPTVEEVFAGLVAAIDAM